jgi:O-antigen ligase
MTEAAAVLGAAGALLALLPRSRVAVVAGLGLIAVAEILLASDLVPGGLGSKATSMEGIAGLALGLPVLAALAALFVRYPAIVPPVVVAVAPFRLPFEFGAENRFFIDLAENGKLGRLIPLYAVVAAAGLALAWRAFRTETPRAVPTVVAAPMGFLAALIMISLLWAADPPAAKDRLVFFVVPFTALLAVVARAPFRAWLPRVLAIETVAIASVLAAIGIAEAAARELIFYDPKIAVANNYTSYFRVTSLFSDPSIYGRHLVVAIAILLAALWLGRVRFALGAGLVAFLWAGLFFSYSQSSLVALGTAVVAVTFLAADRRVRRAMAFAAAGLAAVGVIAFFTLVRDESIDRVTSGRSELVNNTAVVIGNHPLAGVGVASQPRASRDEAGGARDPSRHVSHTTPLTIAAELGILGLLAYLALLASAVRILAEIRRSNEAYGLGLIAVAVVLFVHSLFYGVFFEDPITWIVLALAAGYVASTEPRAEAARRRHLRRWVPQRAPVTAPP